MNFLDRIDAGRTLEVGPRWRAAMALYQELDQTDGVDAVTWRSMAIELGVLAQLAGPSDTEMARSRQVDCHQRADTLRALSNSPTAT